VVHALSTARAAKHRIVGGTTMDSETHLSQQLTQLFATNLNLAVASPELDLIATGLLDSLTFVDLLVQLEHEFGVQIDLDNLKVDNFRSIASIAAFIATEKMVNLPRNGT
jgi:acyl carrier protein